MDYGNMDILDTARELSRLLIKIFNGNVNKTEVEQMRILSNNFSKECSHILYDWGK